ncbi:MAG: hypothetical protein AB1481_06360 [Candidatus Omnitrophota bacterium]
MEKVLCVSSLRGLSRWKSSYARLYFGAEFCQRLIPKKDELKKALEFCKKRKINFSLMTPFVTDEGMAKLKPLFKLLDKYQLENEIIVNDLGVAFFLSKNFSHIPLCWGRLLNKQKRDPRIAGVLSLLPKAARHYFRVPVGESIFTTDFKNKFNIKRIELDNLIQGIERQYARIPASLYYPYVYVTTTRYCLVGLAFHEKGFKRKVTFKCYRECQKYSFCLENQKMPAKIYLKGNTQFVYNPYIPQGLRRLNINRIVYEQDLLDK